jgi:hypothetical protein
LASDGVIGQAVKQGNVSLYPSRIPQVIGMSYAGMLLMPLVIEGLPVLHCSAHSSGAMLSQSLTTLATLNLSIRTTGPMPWPEGRHDFLRSPAPSASRCDCELSGESIGLRCRPTGWSDDQRVPALRPTVPRSRRTGTSPTRDSGRWKNAAGRPLPLDISDTGMDFAVGDGAKLSDYVELAEDLPAESISLGRIGDREIYMRPLLGVQAEVLERLCKTRGEWLIGLLACQTGAQPLSDLSAMSEVDAMRAVSDRIEAVRQLPESDFEELFAAYGNGAGALQHFFVLGHDDKGLVCHAREREGAGVNNPARFPARTCVSATARAIFG